MWSVGERSMVEHHHDQGEEAEVFYADTFQCSQEAQEKGR